MQSLEIGRGMRLRVAMKKKRMTQAKLAEVTGISMPSINNYVNDRYDIPLSYAVKIADALGVSLDYLARA